MKGSIALTMCDLIETLFENFDTFETYGVNEYLSSAALTVDRKYRGRGIGDHILIGRCVIAFIGSCIIGICLIAMGYFFVERQCAENLA